MPKKNKAKHIEGDYTAKDIHVLEGLEPVRRRPAMYIGSTGVDGLHHLIWECVDNSVDEAMAGFCKNIEIALMPQNRVKVIDDGRGIPVEKHPQTKKSTLETVMTTLHKGAKFGSKAYKISGGLHGVGVAVVCALSKWVRAEVCRDGFKYFQEYSRGKPLNSVKKSEKCRQTGTAVIFEPDSQIFPDIKFDLKKILTHLRQQAYLTPKVKITIKDLRQKPEIPYSFYFEGGLSSYVKYLIRGLPKRHSNIYYGLGEKNEILIEAAFQYTEEYECFEESFANNINTGEGGTHLTGFRTAITRSFNDYAKKNGLLKEGEDNLTGEDMREGFTGAISVKLREPQFEGQTKARLGNPEVKAAVEAVVSETLSDFLERNPQDARAIIEKCILSSKARRAAKAARETVLRRGALEGLQLPGKLADCTSRNPAESEVYIVEGESAGGCWDGNTKVALADGRNISFKELIKEYKQGKKNFCYTINNNGHINIASILNPRMTKKNAKVIKIILDNGEELVCTPDHLFRLVDGRYVPAAELTLQHSLTPLYRKICKKQGKYGLDGYEMIFDPKTKKWMYTHILADMFNLKNGVYTTAAGKHRHHVDFNKRNNNPTNIQRVSYEQHMNSHYKYIEHTLRRPDVIEKSIRTRQSREFREKIRATMLKPEMRKMLSERAKKQWADEKYGKLDKEKYNQERIRLRDKSLLRYDTICQRFFENNEGRLKEAVLNYNHKIKKIIKLRKRIDVYDLEVPGTHNFALASGVFVHNSAKQARDRRFQAILPIRGKILNVERARLDKILTSKEIRSLIIALGTAIAEDFKLEKARYHRIIIMTDADVDGSHVRTLLLTFFYRYFKPLIEQGYIYIAQPPLYRIQIGKKIEYAYTEEEKEKILTKLQKEKNIGLSIQRYKGLGEMNPEQLWETTMNPQTRILLRVNIEEAKEADRIFDTLMGDEVLPRKKFIQIHAKKVRNLDI